MSARVAARRATRSRRRWWSAAFAALVLAPAVVFGGVVAVAADRASFPTHGLVAFLDREIGVNDEFRYDTHRLMGKILSLCPCTAGLSREQYRRAGFHRAGP